MNNSDPAKLKLNGVKVVFYTGPEDEKAKEFGTSITIALDPESPAVQAKEMLDDILNFYHKDYYNP